MKNLKELTELELIKEILKCDREIVKLLTIDEHNLEHYPGDIMGLGDSYCEKAILIDELLIRRNNHINQLCNVILAGSARCLFLFGHSGQHSWEN